MGFAASTARLVYLVARRNQIEGEYQVVSQHRMGLANNINGLFHQKAQLDPHSPAVNVLDTQIRYMQQADNQLQMHMERLNLQREAVNEEIRGTRRIASEAAKDSFGLMGRQS